VISDLLRDQFDAAPSRAAVAYAPDFELLIDLLRDQFDAVDAARIKNVGLFAIPTTIDDHE